MALVIETAERQAPKLQYSCGGVISGQHRETRRGSTGWCGSCKIATTGQEKKRMHGQGKAGGGRDLPISFSSGMMGNLS